MLYCVRINVRMPHTVDPGRFETLKAEEKVRARTLAVQRGPGNGWGSPRPKWPACPGRRSLLSWCNTDKQRGWHECR
jgi:muconolactone delta-isomerase